MLRDEGREINHHGRVRKFDADGNEIDEDAENEAKEKHKKPSNNNISRKQKLSHCTSLMMVMEVLT